MPSGRAPQRGQLELGPEADLVRLGEPLVGRPVRLRAEARQRLVAHDLARGQRDDGLEDDVEVTGLDHAADAGALGGARLVEPADLVNLSHQLVEDAPVHHAVEDRAALGRAAQRGHELPGGRVADHVPGGARPQHLDQALAIRRVRVRQHPRVRRRRQDRAHGDVSPTWQVRLHERHLRLRRLGELGGLGRALGRADELESAVGAERVARPRGRELLIVRDQDADRHPCHGGNVPPGEAEVNIEPASHGRTSDTARVSAN